MSGKPLSRTLSFLLGALFALGPAAAGDRIQLRVLATGLDSPVGIAHAGDGSERLFLVGQAGSIWIWDGDQVLAEPFLDISDRVESGGEQGLLGLAFHPGYVVNGEFFVHYTALGTGDTRVTRFRVTGDPDRADPDSEEMIFGLEQPSPTHNGGQIGFGVDGFLYIALGDGSLGNDPGNVAQDPGEFFGKILRIDIDGVPPYEIPPDNPFVDEPGVLNEIWALGLRNPWRFSFDRLTGDLFIGDVGQATIEEIDFQLASSQGGENYGWRRMEGSDCVNPPVDCNDGRLTLPILEYSHQEGDCSVTAGYRYRGSAFADLSGLFIYGDYCSGRIWGGEPAEDGSWTADLLIDTELAITSFGEDERGEVYLVDQGGSLQAIEGLVPREPTLSVIGSCPGTAQVISSGLTPTAPVGFVVGGDLGSSVVPVGPCAGTELELDAAVVLASGTADAGGEIILAPDLPEPACQRLVQAIDLTDCETTNVEPIP